MSENVLLEPSGPPTDETLRAVLGEAYPHFVAVQAAAPGFARDWKHYGRKYGWKYRIFGDRKSLLELTVKNGAFLVGMAVRQAEWQALQTEEAAAELRRLAAEARLAPEGYGVKLEVVDAAARDLALALIAFVAAKRAGE
jgi:hypothetical protein